MLPMMKMKKLSTLTNLCCCLVESGKHSIYNLIDRLLRLLVTLPASAKLVFSTLNILKTRLRNIRWRMSFLSLVNKEREITEKYLYEDILLHSRASRK
jgi:hypothetical protein